MVKHFDTNKGSMSGMLCSNGFMKGATTKVKEDVTCKRCLAIMKKRGMI